MIFNFQNIIYNVYCDGDFLINNFHNLWNKMQLLVASENDYTMIFWI